MVLIFTISFLCVLPPGDGDLDADLVVDLIDSVGSWFMLVGSQHSTGHQRTTIKQTNKFKNPLEKTRSFRLFVNRRMGLVHIPRVLYTCGKGEYGVW